ncbi:phosphomannomutase [Stella humosa]|uniref:Phosphomannomutase n=1 Tax=Stella humosa TaxID=94 RepID=A0A3N1KZR9_9PROT|nr:phosphomannomutase/phosphoglucomutase [Stella humosa]ROP83696.1 phosphomannomutase [Stella humosa]BBK33032.1 phosphomannomutase [Stella humosa]
MSEAYRFDPTILREYDIRGVIGKTLSTDDARAIGRAFGTIAGSGTIAVGRDGRLSSPGLEEALIEGLTASGRDVVSVGLGPTPMLYYASYALDVAGGIMITGSHNPPDYNGFKMMLRKKPFFAGDIQALGRLAAEGGFATGKGKASHVDMLDRYVERLAQDFTGGRELKVAWDAGNGAAGEAMTRLVARLPGQHSTLFADIDGTFPNHHPDPTVAKNLVDLQAAVAKGSCDLGVAFDGDGDRIGVVDGQGRILWGDQLMQIWAEAVLKDRPGSVVISDVKASQTLFDRIAALGGQPLMWKTGHSHIKNKMAETKSPLAGEMSGHIFFADRYYGYDDALYAAIRLLNVVAGSPETLAQMRDRMAATINTPELRFPCSEEAKKPVMAAVVERLKAAGATYSDVDGVRVNTSDGWWLLRASNTQDVLVARAESTSDAGLDRLKGALADALRAAGIEPPEL